MATAYRNAFANGNRAGPAPKAGPLLTFLLCLLTAFAAPAAQRFEAGLLWRVEREGSQPSYVFGTMHSDHPNVVDLAPPVQRAFDQAGALILEVTLDSESLASLSTALLMRDGRSLEALVGQEVFGRAVAAMAGHGVPEVLVARMKPWAVAVTLMTPPARSGLVLDHVLYRKAVADGKPVEGLETPAEQVALFDSLTLQEQVVLLRDTLNHLPDIERMLIELREAWLQRDLAQLARINEISLRDTDPDIAAAFNQRIIIDRNHRMAERLEAPLREGNRFIAVGALHLPGSQGLLQLLSERGYRITRSY
ncbi:MAG: TraB/GumN family protein [Gammaproteobacteria bacterium]|jgi:hypothetical protein